MPKKRLDASILISALVISAILFGSGVYTGYLLNREKLGSVENDMQSIVKDVQNFQLQFLFVDVLGENSSCPLLTATLSDINKRSYEIGRDLESYGAQSEIQDVDEYTSAKNEYSRLLVGYWLLARKVRESCSMGSNTIIYFYSRDCVTCDNQAFVLTYLKNKYADNLLVFALDAELDEPSIQVIKTYYNITEYPSLVVDEKLYSGFQSTEEIENILGF